MPKCGMMTRPPIGGALGGDGIGGVSPRELPSAAVRAPGDRLPPPCVTLWKFSVKTWDSELARSRGGLLPTWWELSESALLAWSWRVVPWSASHP